MTFPPAHGHLTKLSKETVTKRKGNRSLAPTQARLSAHLRSREGARQGGMGRAGLCAQACTEGPDAGESHSQARAPKEDGAARSLALLSNHGACGGRPTREVPPTQTLPGILGTPPPPPLHGNKGPKLQTGQQAPEAERGCGDRARGLRDPNPVLSPLCPAPRNVAVRPLGEGGGEDNKIGIFVKCFPSHSNKESWTPTPRCNHGNNPQKAVLLKLGSSRHPSL